jgi:hypothetical protein
MTLSFKEQSNQLTNMFILVHYYSHFKYVKCANFYHHSELKYYAMLLCSQPLTPLDVVAWGSLDMKQNFVAHLNQPAGVNGENSRSKTNSSLFSS